MKSTIKLMVMAILAGSLMIASPVSAQTSKEAKKERKEMEKQQAKLEKEIYSKPHKEDAKKAKKLEKEGWTSMSTPIAQQLHETKMKRAELDASGNNRYIVVEIPVTANSFIAAQSQAENIARLRIASELGSSVAALTDVALANNHLSNKEAASLSKSVENAKIIVSQKLGRVIKTMEIYRELDNGNYQISIAVAYDMAKAAELMHESIVEDLKNDSEVNKKQLETLIGFDKIMEQTSKSMKEYDEIAE